ncbi:helicase-exonuclease AddAB subunit AddA [Planctomycetota bacterium]
MADKKIQWTKQQQMAISARGSDVLVTASAGTGKTAVLSGRCADIVSDKNICPDIRNILVMTFTNAAAEEMRSRIGKQLTSVFEKNKEPHLRAQIMLLEAADISTIHAFCNRLISEYFYELGLDPAFRVIEADEQNLLKNEVLEKTIEWAWQQSNLSQAAEQLFYRRGFRLSDGFAANIIQTSNFLDGLVGRDKWYERTVLLAKAVDPFAGDLGKRQKQIIAEKLQRILGRLSHCEKLYAKHGENGEWLGKFQVAFVEPIGGALKALQTGDFDKCSQIIREYEKPRVSGPKDIEKPIADLIKNNIKDAVDNFADLAELAVLNPAYLEKLSSSVSLQTRLLAELVRKFDQFYQQAKQAANCLDFADLEHYALKLLTDDEDQPSKTALSLQQRYKHIFVDEYQDINAIQKAILDRLTVGGNIFVVGDIKQSIYAFRGAEPGIFRNHLKKASSDSENTSQGLRIDLNTNFRSQKPILDFVNKIFSAIMIDYDESARLRPPESSVVRKGPAVELHILDDSQSDQVQKFTARERQAMMIAERIEKIVSENDGVEYGDIVILMRSPAKRVNDYVEVLRSASIPVNCELTAGYFEATEISDCLCLLKVLDNPQRDIELASVLRSPFFKVTDSELAKIKLCGNNNFYQSVMQYCQEGPDEKLSSKLSEILTVLGRWRTIGRRGNLADLIWRVYSESSLLSFVQALPNGQWRKANLLKLHDRAIQFETFAAGTRLSGLSRFVQFVQKLQDSGQDWNSAEPAKSTENAVRIMSIHKSKGLEFPVVFLAELDSKFNTSDSSAELLADSVHTLGLKVIDRDSNSKLSSLAHQVIAEEKLTTNLAEEMRILYVALTRATDKVILTASQSTIFCRDIVMNGFYAGGKKLPDWQIRSCKRPLEWILYGLSDQKVLHRALQTDMVDGVMDDKLFTVTIHSGEQLQQVSNKKSQEVQKSQPTNNAAMIERLKKSLSWEYKFRNASMLEAKQSVTELTHSSDEYAKINYADSLERKPKVLLSGDLTRRPDSRLAGSASHLVISKIDLSCPVTEVLVKETIDALLSAGQFDASVAQQIDVKSIVAFFQSDLGGAVFEPANTTWREWPFSFSVPADNAQETVIVQGIIDMLIQTPAGLMVIDFKTDRITAEQVMHRAEIYHRQLALYGQAAAAIKKTKIIGKWLYFLTPGCEIQV